MTDNRVQITQSVGAICRDALERWVKDQGEVQPNDPMWPVVFEAMQGYHRFAQIVGYRAGVDH